MKKRFYETVTVVHVDGGYSVQLDGRNVKTPMGSLLVMPSKALSEVVAQEWNAQGDEIDPKSMAFMPLVGTAIDRVNEVRDDLIDGLLKYAETDLLCHFADESLQIDLYKRQVESWQPILDWADNELGARLKPTQGIMAKKQDSKSLKNLRKILNRFDQWTLTALGELVGISGSLLVGLALIKGFIDIKQALVVCHIDEDHQIEQWGEDFEAQARRKNVERDITNAYRFFELANA